MERIPCPQCGAEVEFASRVSVYSVCRHCSSTLLRSNFDIRLLGQMAALQEDPTVFQLGTTGVYANDGFELIGRVQRRWSGGMWNEWYMYFGGDKGAWLAEAQGFLMVSSRRAIPTPNESNLRVGGCVKLDGVSFRVKDMKEVLASFAEGELPLVAEQGSTMRSIDLSGPGRTFATVAYDDHGSEVYIGEVVTFSELQFKRVREISGW